MNVTIYHNPDCGTSRSTLKLIRACGIEPAVVEYLKTPPDAGRLRGFADAMGVSLREIMREKGTPFAALGLGSGKSVDELLAAIRQHPILINRPIVVSEAGSRLCRPSEIVLDILPDPPRTNITRDDGTPFLRDRRLDPEGLTDLIVALEAAGLPTGDLGDPGRTFFHHRRLDDESVGWGGFELYGADALLRSMTVEPHARRQGNGRNLAALLMRRAHECGARQAYALTDNLDSRAFFEAAGFLAIERNAAPASIRGTRQVAELCPASAVLLTKPITFA